MSSSWGIDVLDNGGLIVAAQDYCQYISNPLRTLKYSRSFMDFINLTINNVVIFGVVTEPGESTAVVRYDNTITDVAFQGLVMLSP